MIKYVFHCLYYLIPVGHFYTTYIIISLQIYVYDFEN